MLTQNPDTISPPPPALYLSVWCKKKIGHGEILIWCILHLQHDFLSVQHDFSTDQRNTSYKTNIYVCTEIGLLPLLFFFKCLMGKNWPWILLKFQHFNPQKYKYIYRYAFFLSVWWTNATWWHHRSKEHKFFHV